MRSTRRIPGALSHRAIFLAVHLLIAAPIDSAFVTPAYCYEDPRAPLRSTIR